MRLPNWLRGRRLPTAVRLRTSTISGTGNSGVDSAIRKASNPFGVTIIGAASIGTSPVVRVSVSNLQGTDFQLSYLTVPIIKDREVACSSDL